MNWYRTGTVSIDQAALTNVTGTGTSWLNNVAAGDIFTVNGAKLYEIDAVVSNTSLVLKTPYQETAASGLTYSIIPTRVIAREDNSALVQKMHEILDSWRNRDSEINNWLTSTNQTSPITFANGSVTQVPTPTYLATQASAGRTALAPGDANNLIKVDAAGVASRVDFFVGDNVLSVGNSGKLGKLAKAAASTTMSASSSVATLNMNLGAFLKINMNGNQLSRIDITNIPQADSAIVDGIIEIANTSITQAEVTGLMVNSLVDQSIQFPFYIQPSKLVTLYFYTIDKGASFRITPIMVS